jgi:hypothetical protein
MTVSGIGAVVVAELRAAGYMESTVGQYAKTIKALTEFASGREYSAGLGAEFASMTTSARTGRFSPQRRFDYRRLVTVFDSYVQTGRVDLAVRGRGGGGPRPAGSDFVALDAAWEAEMGRRGLAPATCEAYGRVARGYLVFLEALGIAVLDGADGASVLAFLESLLDRWARRYGQAGASLTCERGLPTGIRSWPVEPQDVGGPSEKLSYECRLGCARTIGARVCFGWGHR